MTATASPGAPLAPAQAEQLATLVTWLGDLTHGRATWVRDSYAQQDTRRLYAAEAKAYEIARSAGLRVVVKIWQHRAQDAVESAAKCDDGSGSELWQMVAQAADGAVLALVAQGVRRTDRYELLAAVTAAGCPVEVA